METGMNQIKSNMLFCTLHIGFFLFSSHVQYDCSCKNSDESTYLRGYAADILTGTNPESKQSSLSYPIVQQKEKFEISPKE